MSDNRLLDRWNKYWQNLRWDDYTPLLFSKANAASALIPIFGYYILFNDALVSQSGFTKLIGDIDTTFVLSTDSRIKFVYFGLVLIGGLSLFANYRKPHVFRRAANQEQYLAFAKSNFTLQDFVHVHDIIENEGRASAYGQFDQTEWNTFLSISRPSQKMSAAKFAELLESDEDYLSGHDFSAAISKHESLVRELVIDFFIRHAKTRRVSLIASVLGISLGYILLIIPSIDLFLRVCEATILGH